MNKYLINVKGKNIANFLIKIDKKKINVLNITFIDNDSINIIIKKEEFDLLTVSCLGSGKLNVAYRH